MNKLTYIFIIIAAMLAACNNEVMDTYPAGAGGAPLETITVSTRAGGGEPFTIVDGSTVALTVGQETANYALTNGSWVLAGGGIQCAAGTHAATATGTMEVQYTGATPYQGQIPVAYAGNITVAINQARAIIDQPLEMKITAFRLRLVVQGAYGDGVLSAFSARFFQSPTNSHAWPLDTYGGYSDITFQPQTTAKGEKLFEVNTTAAHNPLYGATVYTVYAPAAISFEAGKEYHYTIALGGGDRGTIVNDQIAPFNPGGNADFDTRTPGIRTEAELRTFAADWNANATTAMTKWEDAKGSKTIRLLADIPMSDTAFTPIKNFTGVFDGQGHTINGLTISQPADVYVGMFAGIIVGGTVKNLNLTGVNVRGNSNVAGIAGFNNGIVAACSVQGQITGSNNIAGIAGLSSGSITGCYSLIDTMSGTLNKYGITYNNGGTVKGCCWYSGTANTAANSGLTTCTGYTGDGIKTNATLVTTMNTALDALGTAFGYRWLHVSGAMPLLVKKN